MIGTGGGILSRIGTGLTVGDSASNAGRLKVLDTTAAHYPVVL